VGTGSAASGTGSRFTKRVPAGGLV
jgi:hypothetical protein